MSNCGKNLRAFGYMYAQKSESVRNCQEIRLCIIMSRTKWVLCFWSITWSGGQEENVAVSKKVLCLWPPWLTNYQSKDNTGHVVCFSLLFSLSVEKDTFFSLHSVQIGSMLEKWVNNNFSLLYSNPSIMLEQLLWPHENLTSRVDGDVLKIKRIALYIFVM